MEKNEVVLTEMHHDLVDEVMDNFDFERVAKVMEFLDWKWASNLDYTSVPDIYTIRKRARSLMKECIQLALTNESKTSYLSTAGFNVFYNENEKELQLKFVLDEWDAEKKEDS